MNKRTLMARIVLETVTFYAADPKGRRAVEPGSGCCYLTADGRKCALSRYLKDSEAVAAKHNEIGAYGLDSAFARAGGLDSLIREGYEGLTIDFWTSLQGIHDDDSRWTDEGLSEMGMDYVACILRWIDRGEYDRA